MINYFILFCFIFVKMRRGDSEVPQRVPPPALKSVRFLPRGEGRGVPGHLSTPFLLPSPTPSCPLPLRGCPAAAGTTGDLLWGPEAPFSGEGHTHSTLPSSDALRCARRVTAPASELAAS